MANTVSDYFYATVAYADIFAYPLTDDDVYYWFIRTTPPRNIRLRRVKGIIKRDGFMILKGRQSILSSLKKRIRYSRHKWGLARSAGGYLRFIPSIKLVGVTGGLSMRNADRHDDIDFIIITAAGTLWITRFMAVVLLDILHRRRKPDDKNVANKICLNMFMSEDALRLGPKEQDLFAAHEILQMEPLWARGNTYKTFLSSNAWVKTFLPVAWNIKQNGHTIHPKNTHWWTYMGIYLLRFLEWPARFFQLWYMQKRRTVEVVSGGTLRFHPHDARRWVVREFGKRLAKMNIPLDNIFYGS